MRPTPFMARQTVALVSGCLVLFPLLPAATASAAEPTDCTYTAQAGDDVADRVNSLPANSVACFGNGNWTINHTIYPKSGVQLLGTGKSVLEGSVRLQEWSSDGSAWVSFGELNARALGGGECEDSGTSCTTAEDVYDGNHLLKRVNSRAELTADTFYADYSNNALYVGGDDPARHEYRLSTTPVAIQSSASGITVSGLTIQRFAPTAQHGAVEVDGSNWTLSNLRVTKNHGVGIEFNGATGSTLDSSEVSENGQLGVGVTKATGVTVSNSWVHDNNTAGYWIGDWESGGIKATESSVTIRGNRIFGNRGPGVWVDVYCDGVQIVGNTVNGNSSDGVRFEISRNGTIANNTIQNNALGVGRGGSASVWAGGGIVVNTAQGVDVSGNALSGNQHGVSVQYRSRGTAPWGALVLSGVGVHDNTISLVNAGAQMGYVGDSQFWSSLYAAAGSAAAWFDRNHYTVPNGSPDRFTLKWSTGSFATWQAAGLDPNGSLTLQ